MGLTAPNPRQTKQKDTPAAFFMRIDVSFLVRSWELESQAL